MKRYTPQQHIADWKMRYVAGKCSLEDFEWVVAWTLAEVEKGRWPSAGGIDHLGLNPSSETAKQKAPFRVPFVVRERFA